MPNQLGHVTAAASVNVSSVTDDCIVADIAVKTNFNVFRYAGLWYAISVNKPSSPYVISIFTRSDAKARYTPRADGSIAITTGENTI
jgi:hypothetical protein